MSKYPTYQAAKIANPDKKIVTTAPDWDANKDCIGKFEPLSSDHWLDDDSGWTICNPADYCMTVKQFEDSGKKLVDGDLYINLDGNVIEYTEGYGLGVDRDPSINKSRYVLKAKALEETKTYRYEKVEFVSDKEKAEAFIEGGLWFLTHGELKGDIDRDTIPVTRLDELLCGNAIYRRIEVTEKELAVDAAIEIICRGRHDGDAAYKREWFERLFDEGVLVRVNGKG